MMPQREFRRRLSPAQDFQQRRPRWQRDRGIWRHDDVGVRGRAARRAQACGHGSAGRPHPAGSGPRAAASRPSGRCSTQLGRAHHAGPAQEPEEGQGTRRRPRLPRQVHARRRGRRLRFLDDLPADLRVGFAQPGADYPTTVRFSNASAVRPRPTTPATCAAWRCGSAFRRTSTHDLLTTNFPVSHARDADQFVAFAEATAGNSRAVGIVRLAFAVRAWRDAADGAQRHARPGPRGPQRGPRDLLEPRCDPVGPDRAGALPAAARRRTPPAPGRPSPADPELPLGTRRRRLAQGDVRLRAVRPALRRRAADADRGHARSSGPRSVSPPERGGRARPSRSATSSDGRRRRDRAPRSTQLAFNPWNTTEEFRPLGNLNRARKAVYDASSAHRLGYRFGETVPWRNRVLGAVARAPAPASSTGTSTGTGCRCASGCSTSRPSATCCARKNLIDTEPREAPPHGPAGAARDRPETERVRPHLRRHATTTSRDPQMGAVGATFGRNLPPDYRPDLFDEPNPVVVSRELLDARAASSRPAR